MDTLSDRVKQELLSLPNVVGAGTGFKEVGQVRTNDQAIVVLVKTKLPPDQLSPSQMVPQSINGMKTDVIEVGQLKAQGAEGAQVLDFRTAKMRPAYPGISIGHYRITAGTFGAVVYDQESGQPLILSNNHVLANGTNGRDLRARIKDPILQPGSSDLREKGVFGRTKVNPDDILARLHKYVALKKYPTLNVVDCALAEPLKDDLIRPEILGLGKVQGAASPIVDMPVLKSGRTTGVTVGRVRVIDAMVDVDYGSGRKYRFDRQIITTGMSAPGDSGSLVVDNYNRAVGLLFAGSDTSTVLNPIEMVLELLGVKLGKG